MSEKLLKLFFLLSITIILLPGCFFCQPEQKPAAPGEGELLIPLLLTEELFKQLPLSLRQQKKLTIADYSSRDLWDSTVLYSLEVEEALNPDSSGNVVLQLTGFPYTEKQQLNLQKAGYKHLIFTTGMEMIDEQTVRLPLYFRDNGDSAVVTAFVVQIKPSKLPPGDTAPALISYFRESFSPDENRVLLLRHAEPEHKLRIALYTGRGYWPEGMQATKNFLDAYHINWDEVTAADVERDKLAENFDAIWFVGGFSAEYKHYLEGHDKIRFFVENGGVFIGTCAGAYYASETMVWKGVSHTYPLKLFSGHGIGPLSNYLSYGERTTLILNRNLPFNRQFAPTIEMFYFDGPQFLPSEEQPVEVLAYYQVNGAPAIISFAYGKGAVLLMGTHPELGYTASTSFLDLTGGTGAQWPWLYASLQWVFK